MSKPHGFSGARPTFFLALALKARGEGDPGYRAAGYGLGIHVRSLIELEVSDSAMDRLDSAVAEADHGAIWRWFRRTLPRCAELIPASRRDAFVEGVLVAAEEGRL